MHDAKVPKVGRGVPARRREVCPVSPEVCPYHIQPMSVTFP
jgi:hypothetical protein